MSKHTFATQSFCVTQFISTVQQVPGHSCFCCYDGVIRARAGGNSPYLRVRLTFLTATLQLITADWRAVCTCSWLARSSMMIRHNCKISKNSQPDDLGHHLSGLTLLSMILRCMVVITVELVDRTEMRKTDYFCDKTCPANT